MSLNRTWVFRIPGVFGGKSGPYSTIFLWLGFPFGGQKQGQTTPKLVLFEFLVTRAFSGGTKNLAWLHNCTVHSTQYTVHSTQYTVHSTQYTVHSTQYTVHSTQYTVHSTQYTVHSTQYTVHSTQYTVHSTQYTVHSTQYTVHSTQYTVHSGGKGGVRRRRKFYLRVRPTRRKMSFLCCFIPSQSTATSLSEKDRSKVS